MIAKKNASARRSASRSPIRANATPINPSDGIGTSLSSTLGVNTNFNQLAEATGRKILAANPHMAGQDLAKLIAGMTSAGASLPPAYSNVSSTRVNTHNLSGQNLGTLTGQNTLNTNSQNTSTVLADVQNNQKLVMTPSIIDPNVINPNLQNSSNQQHLPRSSN